MLCITRKAGESVFVGKDVEVIVTAVKGNRVKLAFVAPKSVVIVRREVYKEVLK